MEGKTHPTPALLQQRSAETGSNQTYHNCCVNLIEEERMEDIVWPTAGHTPTCTCSCDPRTDDLRDNDHQLISRDTSDGILPRDNLLNILSVILC